jgi:hypothetical protein
LSEGGAFVPASSQKRNGAVGTMLHLTLGIPGARTPLKVRARIARIVTEDEAHAAGGEAGVGLQFIDLRPSDLESIRSVIALTAHA